MCRALQAEARKGLARTRYEALSQKTGVYHTDAFRTASVRPEAQRFMLSSPFQLTSSFRLRFCALMNIPNIKYSLIQCT